MLPPVEDSVLQNNPEFAALYSTLTTSILNPDGSTKNDPAARERTAVRKELDEYRLKAAKQHLLCHAISTANPQLLQAKPVSAPSLIRRPRALSQPHPHPQPQPEPEPATPAAELPAPILDLLLLLPPLLATPSDLPPDSAALLLSSPPLSDLPTHLPHLARLVSSALHSSAVHLARIAKPTTNPSYVHRSVPTLPGHAASLAAAIAERKLAQERARLSATAALTSLLQQQTAVLSQLLRVLEAKHGPVARSLEFRATEAALTAQRQEAEAETALWLARRDTYTPEASRALANYAAHLRDARGRLAEAVRSLRAELRAYGVDVAGGDGSGSDHDETGDGRQGGNSSKERVIREIARVYRDMTKQMEDVRDDLERLGRA